MKSNSIKTRFAFSFFLLTAVFTTVFSQSTTVVFNVNMKYMATQGLFNPSTEFVDLSGSFNNWGSTMCSDTNGDSIYTASIPLNVGDNIEFKARINGQWNGREEFPGGGPNRTYTVVLNGIDNFWYNDLIPSNVLSVNFNASSRSIIPGQSVQFNDISSGNPVQWQWTFPGGNPSGSQVKNPLISYPTAGDYPVSLKITNASGDTTSLTNSQYINVSNPTTNWWNDAVFYEVFVRSFYDQNGDGKGDLKGLISKLDYLNDGDSTTHTDLGITGIWLMPIMQSPSYHGYDVVDYRTVESDYGTNADFLTLIQEAHKRGIKVIIDLVMNHCSDQNPWFTQSASSSTSSYRNWYRWSTTNPGGSWYLKNGAYYYAVFGSGMPDLNYANAATKTEMFDIARFWLQDMHADGFRLDAVKYIFESGTQIQDLPETFQFWQDFRAFYKSVNRDAFAVGEAWTSTPIIKKYVENNGLDFCFEFNVAAALVNAANNGDAATLQTRVDDAMASFPYLQFGTFLTNHDQERVMTTLGNDVTKAKLAAELLLTLPGIPFIYYGEEIGTIGGKPDENIRTPMQWNNSANAGFSTGTPWRAPQTDYTTKNIAAQKTDNNSLWTTYNKLIQIRNTEQTLRRGSYTDLSSNSSSAFVFLRQYQNESVIVASNLSNSVLSNLTINLFPGTLTPGNFKIKDLISGTIHDFTVLSDGSIANQNIGNLAARTTAVYKIINNSSGIPVLNANTISVFPNPAKSSIFIQSDLFTGTQIPFTISDMSGKLIKTGTLSGNTILSVEDLPAGFYLLKVETGSKNFTQKLIISK